MEQNIHTKYVNKKKLYGFDGETHKFLLIQFKN